MVKFEELLKISLNCDTHRNISVMDTELREVKTTIWRCYLCNPTVLYIDMDMDRIIVSPEDFNRVKAIGKILIELKL